LFASKGRKKDFTKNKNKNKNMTTHAKRLSAHKSFDYSLVYLYLLTGIAIFISVFLFLPRISIG